MAINPKTARVEVVGNPDFWQIAHAVNPQAFLAIQALGILWEMLHSKPVHGALPVAIGRMMDVSFKSLHAVVNLTLNGFDTDAMRVARSMWEYEVISDYLRKNPTLVDDYNDFLFAAIQTELELLLEHAPDLLKTQEPGFVEQAKEQIKAAERFRTSKGKLKPSWKDVSIAKMAEDTGRGLAYKSIYRWGSGFVHGDITSIVANFDIQRGHVDVGPSTKYLDLALRTAHHAELCLMTDFNETAGQGLDVDIQNAADAFKAAWTPEDQK